jgi:sigma-E factor negative regulatory protein RseB
VASSSWAGGSDEAESLIEQARDASSNESFAGLVRVIWTDEGGTHNEWVNARSVRGAFVVGPSAHRVTGGGELRWAADPVSGGAGWRAEPGADVPDAGASWDLRLAGDRTVAGRAATVVEATDDDGRVRARFAIESESGQLLERQILDGDGRLVRSVGFATIVATELAPLVPGIPPTDVATPTVIEDVPDGYFAPGSVGDGYRLLGRYQRPDGVVQLYYGDGLFSVSVFQQGGRVDWGALPDGGRSASVEGVRTHSYRTAGGVVVVWSDGDLVLTGIADGPPGTAQAVVASISGDGDSSDVVDKIADFVLSPFDWE